MPSETPNDTPAHEFESFEDFWPFYLSEHKSAASRRLHFLGTSGWFASIALSTALNPVGFSAAMAGFGLVMRDAMKKEQDGPSFKHVALMAALPTLASPIVFPAGIAMAYGCAWFGHFVVEGNRPATFQHPVWSLMGDWKMYGEMLKGRLWEGEQPAQEVGAV